MDPTELAFSINYKMISFLTVWGTYIKVQIRTNKLYSHHNAMHSKSHSAWHGSSSCLQRFYKTLLLWVQSIFSENFSFCNVRACHSLSSAPAHVHPIFFLHINSPKSVHISNWNTAHQNMAFFDKFRICPQGKSISPPNLISNIICKLEHFPFEGILYPIKMKIINHSGFDIWVSVWIRSVYFGNLLCED